MSPPTPRRAAPQPPLAESGHRQATDTSQSTTPARQFAEDHVLALLLAGDDSLTPGEQLNAVRAAYRWGQERGYKAGYDHGYARSGSTQHRVVGPSFAELRRRRGEDPDTGRPLPREGGYPGGPVNWETGESLRNGGTAA